MRRPEIHDAPNTNGNSQNSCVEQQVRKYFSIVPAKIGCGEFYIPVSNAFYQIWYLGMHTHTHKFDQSFKPKVVG